MKNEFDWSMTKSLGFSKILLAVFAPSLFALTGFRTVLPMLVKNGVPPLLAWGSVAGVMLAIFAILACFLLLRDARQLNISIWSRMCLTRVSGRHWVFYIILIALVMALSGLINPFLPKLWALTGFGPVDYYPFFLKGIDPATAPMAQISPGLPLQGAYWVIPFMAVVLLLNIFVEDLYFRAWLLPKMLWMGKAAWVVNGILFALYHTFQLWLLPIILLASLAFAFVVWHSKSVIPSLVFHFILNFLFSILGIIALTMGLHG